MAEICRPTFEIQQPGWTLSFQRSVPSARKHQSPNRGALPCCVMHSDDRHWSLAVPLAPGESVWVGFVLETGVSLVGAVSRGRPLHVASLGALDATRSVHFVDGFAGSPVIPIAPPEVPIVTNRSALGETALVFELNKNAELLIRIAVTLISHPLYTLLTREPLPRLLSPDETYQGWRLP